MKKINYILLAALAFGSCQREVPRSPEPENERVEVTFNVTIPEQVALPTRATDTDIVNIDLLIFDQNNRFINRVPVNVITGAGATKTFSAVLDASDVARTINIVANGRTSTNADRVNFSSIATGALESTAIQGLVTNPMTTASEGAMMPLIMWGRKVFPSISSSTTDTGVNLLRSQAKIDVRKGTDDGSNGLNNFQITSATLHSASSSGRVAPTNYANPTNPQTSHSEPTGVSRINYYTSNGYISTGANPILYLYERANTAANHMSLIIGGTWKGTPGYYKVILRNNSDVLYNIIRNHRYVVTVVRASGVGYATIAEAAASDDSNIAIQITDENDLFHFAYADETTALFASDNVLKIFYNPSSGMMEAKSIVQVLAYDLTMGINRRPTVSCDNVPGLSVSSTTTAVGIDGRTYQIVDATFNGLTGASGHITVSYLNLVHKIDVTVEMVGWTELRQHAVRYRSALFENGNNKPWTATVQPKSAMLYRLNNIKDDNAQYMARDLPMYGYSSLNSSTSDGAWIYSVMGGVNQLGMIDITYIDSGNIKKGKAIVFPY